MVGLGMRDGGVFGEIPFSDAPLNFENAVWTISRLSKSCSP